MSTYKPGQRSKAAPFGKKPHVDATEENLRGNFKNYYSSRQNRGRKNKQGEQSDREKSVLKPGNQDTVVIDERLEVLNPSWFKGKRVLDLGCNEGKVSLDLASSPAFCPSLILGVDIDKELVHRARKRYRDLKKDHPQFKPIPNIESHPESSAAGDKANQGLVEPGTVSIGFRCEDITTADAFWYTNPVRYDVVLCLSLTKWIQIQGGDEQLKTLFERIHKKLDAGGRLILEPQPWKSYARTLKLVHGNETSESRDMRLQVLQDIKLRPENFVDFLLHKTGFSESIIVRSQKAKGEPFNRPLYCLLKGAETSCSAGAVLPEDTQNPETSSSVLENLKDHSVGKTKRKEEVAGKDNEDQRVENPGPRKQTKTRRVEPLNSDKFRDKDTSRGVYASRNESSPKKKPKLH